MKQLEALKNEVQHLANKADSTLTSIEERNSTDSLRKNIQRGKLIAYEHVLSLIDEQLKAK